MRWRTCLTAAGFLALLVSVSCRAWAGAPTPAAEHPAVRFFDRAAEDVATNAAREVEKSRPKLTLEDDDGKHVVVRCRDYLDRTSSGAQPATDHDGAVTPNYLMCAVAALAPSARPSATVRFDDAKIGETIYRYLDLTSFVSSLSAEAETGKTSLVQMEFEQVDVTPTGVEVETPDWNYSFQALAAGDFDGDGFEDLLVAFTDDAKRGTAFVATTLLLHRTGNAGPVRAELPRWPSRPQPSGGAAKP